MAWNFYKRIKVLPGLTMNVGKRGISFSLGTRGVRITVGRNGVRQTLSFLGTGIYHTVVHKLSRKKM